MGGLNKNRHKNKSAKPPTTLIKGNYSPPPRNECEESPIAYLINDNPLIRTTGKMWKQGRLVDFIISVQYRETETSPWKTHIVIDCSHNNAHVHHYKNDERDGKPPESLKILNTAADIQEALKLAITYTRQAKSELESKMERGQ